MKLQFDSFTRRIVASVSSALAVSINSIIVYQKKHCCSFVSSSEMSTKLEYSLSISIANRQKDSVFVLLVLLSDTRNFQLVFSLLLIYRYQCNAFETFSQLKKKSGSLCRSSFYIIIKSQALWLILFHFIITSIQISFNQKPESSKAPPKPVLTINSFFLQLYCPVHR